MKFGKLLAEQMQQQFDKNPEIGQLFLRYKQLKKSLKRKKELQEQQGEDCTGAEQLKGVLDGRTVGELKRNAEEVTTSRSGEDNLDSAAEAPCTSNALSEDDQAFIDMLNQDLARFNDFFIEKEEESIIKLQTLEDRAMHLTNEEDLDELQRAFVDFHGEMVLLLHWSLLNYAAVVKILKKHDKLTGCLLKAPYLANVLHQPFYSTEAISRLVKGAESRVKELSERKGQYEADKGVSLSKRKAEPALLKRTQAALGLWQEMGDKASTPSTVLPTTALTPQGEASVAKRLRIAEPQAIQC